MSRMVSQTYYRIRANYYTPMTKPLGVNVPGSPTSSMPGTAPLVLETVSDNPFVGLATEITKATLTPLTVSMLRELIAGIRAVSGETVSKSGKKAILIQWILASPHKEAAVFQFLADKEVHEERNQERLAVKLFTSLRGALRRAGTEILRDLHLPYSVSALPEDPLPIDTHRPGECPDPEHACMVCCVFGSLRQTSLFRNYTPPLVHDPEQKLALPQEMNQVFIRVHKRNMHRPDGSTLNFNQQYFGGVFTTDLWFPEGLPDPIALGFLLNCLERCADVGAAKAWGAGRLFIQSYTLQRVERTYTRTWTGEFTQLIPNVTVTPLKAELDQAFTAYAQWIAQVRPELGEPDTGEVIA